MKTILTISCCTQEGDQIIRFGVPEGPQELLQMYQLRYHMYVEKKRYIPANLCPDGLEIDHIDHKGGCYYLVAQCGDDLVGTLRIIRQDPLPLRQYYWRYEEPLEMSELQYHQKVEIGRLIADHPPGITIPSGLIPLGLIRCATHFCLENDIHAAYANLKIGLALQLERWGLPVHWIDSYESIYDEASEDPLKNYFTDPNDAACPTYFYPKEVARFYDQLLRQDSTSPNPLRALNPMESMVWREEKYARTL